MRRLVLLGAAAPSFTGLLDHYGALAVFIFVVIENFGAPIPGETMLVAASAYAARGHLNIGLVVVACIAGVWLGATLSYLAGRSGGAALMGRLRIPERHLLRAQGYMDRWGGYTVCFGRYVAFLRSYIGWLAGINRMRPTPFYIWNLAGATLWTLTFATLGYLLGNNWGVVERIFKALGVGGVFLVAAGLLGYVLFRRWRSVRTADTEFGAEAREEAVSGKRDAEAREEAMVGEPDRL